MVLMFVGRLLPVVRPCRRDVMTGMILLGQAYGCGMFIATRRCNRRVRCQSLEGQDQHQQANGDSAGDVAQEFHDYSLGRLQGFRNEG